jgi:CAAX protease family protein
MSPIKEFVRRRPLLTYFVLTFAISWGGFLLAVGPGGFGSTNWEAEPGFLPAVIAMLAGPTVAGLLVTGLIDGRAGVRRLFSRLLRWRVAIWWYALALLTAPLLAFGALSVLSLSAPIFTAENRAAVLLSGILAGLSVVLEEIGWTGFAVPRLRLRCGVLTTGLIVGPLWAAWHLLQQIFVAGTYAAGLPLALFVSLSVLGAVVQLTAYRLLLVWLYDRTNSLLLVMLMHGSLTASTIFIFRPVATGVTFLAYGWLISAGLWILVAAVILTSGDKVYRPLYNPRYGS